jgi:predicted RNase H-like HicB family nuclease
MPKQFDVVIEQDREGYYVASVPALRGCHTQAKSLDDLMGRIKEAIELCLEESEDEAEMLTFVGVQRVRVDHGEAA